jgi:hypothetical protein
MELTVEFRVWDTNRYVIDAGHSLVDSKGSPKLKVATYCGKCGTLLKGE